MPFLQSPHPHAKVAALDDTSNPSRLDDFLDGLSNLGREALLDLQAAGEDFYEARNFAQANHFAIRNVGDVHLAEKWQHMVLAEAEHFDVLHDHHFVISNGKQSVF